VQRVEVEEHIPNPKAAVMPLRYCFACNTAHGAEGCPRKRPGGRGVQRLRRRIYDRDHGTCQGCGQAVDFASTWELDHIEPFSMGGTEDPSNLQVLCRPCNRLKG
jgi:5-methylcytosine-specific restriction endonuclease McrA